MKRLNVDRTLTFDVKRRNLVCLMHGSLKCRRLFFFWIECLMNDGRLSLSKNI